VNMVIVRELIVGLHQCGFDEKTLVVALCVYAEREYENIRLGISDMSCSEEKMGTLLDFANRMSWKV